jgi:uncharacterized protein (DUF342 family)
MAAVIAKGNASITINTQETEAKLVFVPDPEGLGWDVDAVVKLTGENRLSPPPSPKLLEPFLQKAARVKTQTPMELVLFEGVPPEDPVSEGVSWELLPVPEYIMPYKDETLAKAAPPELYRVKTEKIKKETIVKKAASLPFLPPKEELVVTWEKKETREAVAVNPAFKDIKYVEKGKKAGVATPPKPGKPGKNVFGRPIPPANTGEGGILFGLGLVREKSDVYAQYSGLLRIGENWADVVPLAKPQWSVSTGSDGVTLFFKFEPGDPRFPQPTGAEVRAAALAQGAAETILVPVQTLDEAIQESIKTGEAVLAFSLFQVQEAAARVDISPDRLKASLYLRKGVAGARPLEMKAISQALRDSKVQGFDPEQLKAAIHAFMEGPDLELKEYVLVSGIASTRGKDRDVKVTVELLPEAAKTALLERLKTRYSDRSREAAKAFPLEEVSGMALVEKGACIARVGVSSAGEAGKDIFGNVLPGLPGNDPELKLFRGLQQHGSDIKADQGGLLLIKASERNFWGELIDYRDGKISTHISEDAMEASVDLLREIGAGLPLNQEAVLKALAETGVVKGIDHGAVENACRLALNKGECAAQFVAKGEPPVPKGGVSIKWLVPINQPRNGRAQSLSVSAGAALAEISGEEAEGRPGFNVKGIVLEPEKGTLLAIEHDDSIREAALEKGKRLVAARAGELNFDGKVLKISTLQGIQGDVGPSTGNIKFSGEIRVAGKVQPGFAVIGGLNVLIAGSADSALISAGGKVIVTQGVRGGGKGVIRARNTIEALFVEQATLMAVEDIRVKSGCVRCNIKTNGKLLVAAEDGKLVGGVCKARLGVNAGDIGSEQGNQTEISFGQDYLIKDQIEVTDEEIEKVRAALEKVDEKIKQVIRIPLSLDAARAEKVKLMKLLEQLNLKVFTLRERFEEHHDSEVRIRGTVYPGVVMESHDRYYEIKQARSKVIFYFDRESGRIKEKHL